MDQKLVPCGKFLGILFANFFRGKIEVALSGAQVLMAQQDLDATEVHSPLKAGHGKGVAQNVGGQLTLDPAALF